MNTNGSPVRTSTPSRDTANFVAGLIVLLLASPAIAVPLGWAWRAFRWAAGI